MTGTSIQDRAFGALLHPRARELAVGDWSGSRYLLLVTYRRDGRTVATPVWFAPAGGVLYVRTEAGSGKVKRIRREPRVLIAPSHLRGTPLEPALGASARILEDNSGVATAERALAARYGLAQRVYQRLFGASEPAYLE